MSMSKLMDNMMDDTDVSEELESQEVVNMPVDVTKDTAKVTSNSLPEKSRPAYEKEYNLFCAWRKKSSVKGVSEDIILAYMEEKAKERKPSSLWSYFSMLKAMLCLKENIDIGRFGRCVAFLKREMVAYKPKKPQVLEREQIHRFLRDAPNDKYLMMKVVAIMGIAGGCRREELHRMTLDDVDDRGSVLVVKVTGTRGYKERVFSVVGQEGCVDAIDMFRKYVAMRPSTVTHKKLFLTCRGEKCINTPVGINIIGSVPRRIAEYLQLPDPELFTGHCFRRSSATLRADTGADLLTMKPHTEVQSSATVAATNIEQRMLNVRGSEIYYTEAVGCKENGEQKAFLVSDKRTHVSVPLLPLVAASSVIRSAAKGHCHCQEVCISVPDFSHQTLHLLSDLLSGKKVSGTFVEVTRLRDLCCVLGMDLDVISMSEIPARVETNHDTFVPVTMNEDCLPDMENEEDCSNCGSFGLKDQSEHGDALEQKATASIGIFDSMASKESNACGEVFASTAIPQTPVEANDGAFVSVPMNDCCLEKMIKEENCSETSQCSFGGDPMESSVSSDMFEPSGTSGIGIFDGTASEEGTREDIFAPNVAGCSYKCSKQEVMEMDTDDEQNVHEMQEEHGESAKETTSSVLPEKSVEVYEKQYQCFATWRIEKNIRGAVTEEVLLDYFTEKANVYKSSSLFSRYSMLKATLKIRDNVDIGQFQKLLGFVKQYSAVCRTKKPKTLSRDDINKFMLTAPDDDYLFIKVALIIGIAGSCQRQELFNLTIDDVEDKDSVIVISIPDSSTHKRRVVTIFKDEDDVVDPLALCRKYLSLRPMVKHRRLFACYRNRKCSVQAVGIKPFGKIPQKIAEFLGLENPELYTGHCVRRSSAKLLGNK